MVFNEGSFGKWLEDASSGRPRRRGRRLAPKGSHVAVKGRNEGEIVANKGRRMFPSDFLGGPPGPPNRERPEGFGPPGPAGGFGQPGPGGGNAPPGFFRNDSGIPKGAVQDPYPPPWFPPKGDEGPYRGPPPFGPGEYKKGFSGMRRKKIMGPDNRMPDSGMRVPGAGRRRLKNSQGYGP